MSSLWLTRVTTHVAAAGAALTLASFVVGGREPAVATLVGALVALANWSAIRWIGRRVERGSVRDQATMMILLALKLGALMAICWILLARAHLHPTGFAVGVSALVVGLVSGYVRELVASEQGSVPESEGASATADAMGREPADLRWNDNEEG